jgi:hypothetical protein
MPSPACVALPNIATTWSAPALRSSTGRTRLAQLLPAGLPRGLTANTAAAALRSIRPRAVLARTLRQVAVELLSEVRRLDRRIAEATPTPSG